MQRLLVPVIAFGVVHGLGPGQSHAQPASGGSYVIPYEAVIQLHGTPINGPVGVRFSLYASADVGEVPFWEETHVGADALLASHGRCSVALGAVTPLPAEELRRPAVYLGLTVLDLDASNNPTGNETPLLGRQLLSSVPYAWGGAPGQPFRADGELQAGIGASQVVVGHDGNTGYLACEGAGGVALATGGAVRATVTDTGLDLGGHSVTGLADGTVSGQAVHFGQFPNNLSSIDPEQRDNAGYQVLPSGLIIQWRRYLESGSTSPQSIPLPTEFPNAGLMAQVSWDGLLNPTQHFVSVNKTDWTLQISANHSPTWMNLFAIGY